MGVYGILVLFSEKWYIETKIWTFGIFIAAEVSLLSEERTKNGFLLICLIISS